MTLATRALLALSLSFGALPAQGASSDWFETEGGRIRLVTTGAPARDGTLRAALQIDLAPGWKTYWRDPGGAGVPPRITIEPSEVSIMAVGYPPPRRFDDGGAKSAGYERPIALALTLHSKNPQLPPALEADIFLGLCQSICIPVQATLTLDPHQRVDDVFDRSTVHAAFDSLPEEASPAFGVTQARIEGDTLVVDVAAEASSKPLALFVAGGDAYQFGEPAPVIPGMQFAVPILSKSAGEAPPTTIPYTLSDGMAAVRGEFALP